MVALRIANSLRAMHATRLRAPQANRTFTASPRFMTQQGYGDGKGDQVSENPQKQPESSGAQHKSEHPGPSSPDTGKGLEGQSGGAQSKDAKETGSSPTGGGIANAASRDGGEGLKGPQGKGAPSPKIHNQSVPGATAGLSKEQKEEVERHNADFEKRHDRAAPANDDKVDKKFWQGTGGVAEGEAKGQAAERKGTEIDWNA